MEKDVKIKDLSFKEVHECVNAIVETLFTKGKDGSITYNGVYNELLRAYVELVYFVPDLELHKVDIFEFFDRYCNKEFDDVLFTLRGTRRGQYVESTVTDTVENLLRHYCGGALVNSVNKFMGNLNTVVEKYSNSLDNIGSEDIKSFIQDFAGFAGKITPETLTAAVLNKNKPVQKTKKTSKATIKKETV